MRIRIKRKLSGAYVSCQTERLPAALNRPNHAAADSRPRIPGGLGSEIVGHIVYYHRFSDDILDPKPFVIKGNPSVAVIAHQRRKIARMAGVETSLRIIMSPGTGKGHPFGTGTRAVFMNMKPEKICRTGVVAVRQIK